jgi:hypothetical protein
MDYGQPEKYVYSFLDTSPALHESRRNAFSGMNAAFLLKNGKIMTTDIDRRFLGRAVRPLASGSRLAVPMPSCRFSDSRQERGLRLAGRRRLGRYDCRHGKPHFQLQYNR